MTGSTRTSITAPSWRLREKYAPNRILALIDKKKAEEMKKEFVNLENGMDIATFAGTMTQSFKVPSEESIAFIEGLALVFFDCDTSGDGRVDWSEVVDFMIELAGGDGSTDSADLVLGAAGQLDREKPLPRYQASTAKDITTHCEGIVNVEHLPSEDCMVLCEKGPGAPLRVFDTQVPARPIEALPLPDELRQDCHGLKVAYDEANDIMGGCFSRSILCFWEDVSPKSMNSTRIRAVVHTAQPQIGIWHSTIAERWLTAGTDCYLRAWPQVERSLDPTTDSLKPLQTMAGHNGAISTLIDMPRQNTIASGSLDATVLLWDAHTLLQHGSVKGPTSAVRSLDYSDHYDLLLCAGCELSGLLLSPKPNERHNTVAKLRGTTPLVGAKFLQDQPVAVTVDELSLVCFWDLRKMECYQKLQLADQFEHLEVLHRRKGNGTQKAGAKEREEGWEQKAKPKKIATREEEFDSNDILLAGSRMQVLQHSGTSLDLYGFKDKLAQNRRRAQPKNGDKMIACVNSLDSTLMVCVEQHIHCFSLKTSKLVQIFVDLVDESEEITAMCLDAAHTRVVLGSDRGRLQIIDAKTGAHVTSLMQHRAAIAAVAYLPRDKGIASVDLDGSLFVHQDAPEEGYPYICKTAIPEICMESPVRFLQAPGPGLGRAVLIGCEDSVFVFDWKNSTVLTGFGAFEPRSDQRHLSRKSSIDVSTWASKAISFENISALTWIDPLSCVACAEENGQISVWALPDGIPGRISLPYRVEGISALHPGIAPKKPRLIGRFTHLQEAWSGGPSVKAKVTSLLSIRKSSANAHAIVPEEIKDCAIALREAVSFNLACCPEVLDGSLETRTRKQTDKVGLHEQDRADVLSASSSVDETCREEAARYVLAPELQGVVLRMLTKLEAQFARKDWTRDSQWALGWENIPDDEKETMSMLMARPAERRHKGSIGGADPSTTESGQHSSQPEIGRTALLFGDTQGWISIADITSWLTDTYSASSSRKGSKDESLQRGRTGSKESTTKDGPMNRFAESVASGVRERTDSASSSASSASSCCSNEYHTPLRFLAKWQAHGAAVVSSALIPGANGLVTGGADMTIKFWSLQCLWDHRGKSLGPQDKCAPLWGAISLCPSALSTIDGISPWNLPWHLRQSPLFTLQALRVLESIKGKEAVRHMYVKVQSSAKIARAALLSYKMRLENEEESMKLLRIQEMLREKEAQEADANADDFRRLPGGRRVKLLNIPNGPVDYEEEERGERTPKSLQKDAMNAELLQASPRTDTQTQTKYLPGVCRLAQKLNQIEYDFSRNKVEGTPSWMPGPDKKSGIRSVVVAKRAARNSTGSAKFPSQDSIMSDNAAHKKAFHKSATDPVMKDNTVITRGFEPNSSNTKAKSFQPSVGESPKVRPSSAIVRPNSATRWDPHDRSVMSDGALQARPVRSASSSKFSRPSSAQNKFSRPASAESKARRPASAQSRPWSGISQISLVSSHFVESDASTMADVGPRSDVMQAKGAIKAKIDGGASYDKAFVREPRELPSGRSCSLSSHDVRLGKGETARIMRQTLNKSGTGKQKATELMSLLATL